MNTQEAIVTRRSVRSFTGERVQQGGGNGASKERGASARTWGSFGIRAAFRRGHRAYRGRSSHAGAFRHNRNEFHTVRLKR